MIGLTLRTEGPWLVAYLTKDESMADALELGRVRARAADYGQVQEAFIALGRLMITSAYKDERFAARLEQRLGLQNLGAGGATPPGGGG